MVSYNVISKVLILSLIVFSCIDNKVKNSFKEKEIHNESQPTSWPVDKATILGETQGTTFVVKTSEDSLLVSASEVDSILKTFDKELSGYDSLSILSQLNAAKDTFKLPKNNYFTHCFDMSYSIFLKTDGVFDPSIFPLVREWGFFKYVHNPPSKSTIDSVLSFVSFSNGLHYEYKHPYFLKKDNRFQVDFNAIAQGYAVDVLAEFLLEKGQQHFYIEIGGEIVTRGFNNEEMPWVIGVDYPNEENTGTSSHRPLENYIALSGKGLATSGSYRKFYEVDGKRYSHTLDPKTGYPVQHSLLSATVVADNAAQADGYATAFMVMGVKNTMLFLEQHPELNLGVYLLFENESGRIERVFNKEMENYFLD